MTGSSNKYHLILQDDQMEILDVILRCYLDLFNYTAAIKSRNIMTLSKKLIRKVLVFYSKLDHGLTNEDDHPGLNEIYRYFKERRISRAIVKALIESAVLEVIRSDARSVIWNKQKNELTERSLDDDQIVLEITGNFCCIDCGITGPEITLSCVPFPLFTDRDICFDGDRVKLVFTRVRKQDNRVEWTVDVEEDNESVKIMIG